MDSILHVSLQTILHSVQIPDFQRSIDPQRVDSIVQTFQSYSQSNSFFPWGIVTFAYLSPQPISILPTTLYLIDGQHRFSAMKTLSQQTHPHTPTHLWIQLIHCKQIQDMIHYFQMIAQCKEVPDYILQADPTTKSVQLLKRLEEHIQTHYQPFLSTSLRPHKPNIHLPTFLTILQEVDWWKSISSSQELIQRFEQANQRLSIDMFKDDPDQYQHIEKKKKKQHTIGLHISKLKYWWTILDIDELPSPKSFDSSSTSTTTTIKRKSFSSFEKKKLWNRDIGPWNEIFKAPCFIGICGNFIYRDSFHIGHIQPLSKGGTNDLDNLRLICETCNKTMGVKNLNDFKQEMETLYKT
jgi:5-methylcytosine-specific restriction endonuclease McrA